MITAPTQLVDHPAWLIQGREIELPPLDPLLDKASLDPEQFLSDLKAKKRADETEKNRIITLINNVAANQVVSNHFKAISQSVYLIFNKIAWLCNQILNSDFEREQMLPYDALITAACVVDLERTQGRSSKPVFIDKSVTTTRSLQYCPKKRQVAVIACPRNAKLKERGTYKRVVSSALLNLAAPSQPARPAVFAHASSLDNKREDFKDVDNGLKLLRKVTPSPIQGICSLESVVTQYGADSPVDIKAVFEGYQGTIDQIINDEVFVSDLEKLIIMRDLVHGLIHLHKQNVINGDIKPANALFCVDGTPEGAKGALNDFDLAFSLEAGGKPSMVFGWGYYGSILFTDPHHYGKEKVKKQPIEYYKQLDSWALGCLLLQFWKQLPVPPWSDPIYKTYRNDFKKNDTHKDQDNLVKSQKEVFDIIEKTIEKPLTALLEKEEKSCSFSEKVEKILYFLLMSNPQKRMQLVTCESQLNSLIEEAKASEDQLREQKRAKAIEAKESLKKLVAKSATSVAAVKEATQFVDVLLNRDAKKECLPFSIERIKKLLQAVTEIAGEKEAKPQPVNELIAESFALFKVLQSARFEKSALRLKDAWQLAAYSIIELKSDAKLTMPLHLSHVTSGLSHDLQFDPRSSLVTILAGRSRALKNIAKETAHKHYKSAISFSLTDPVKKLVNTLYMRNADTLNREELQTIAKEMRLCEYIKKKLPLKSEMPVLQPLSYRQEDPSTYKEGEWNYNYISAIYPEFQGSLRSIIDGSETVTFQQRLSLAEELLRKLLSLHQMGIALGNVYSKNALFQFKGDDQVEAVWIGLRSAYLVNEPNPEVVWPFEWGIYSTISSTEPQFFGCENVQLTSRDHYRLDAWAFGVMLHELFIGPVAWGDEMCDCFKIIKIDKKAQPNESVQTKHYLTSGRERIANQIEATIEKPFKELSAKPDPTKEEQLKLLIWKLLRYKREERITLEMASQALIGMS